MKDAVEKMEARVSAALLGDKGVSPNTQAEVDRAIAELKAALPAEPVVVEAEAHE